MKVSKKYLIWTILFSVIALAINVYIIVHACLDGVQSTEASKGIIDTTEEIINDIKPGTINESNYSDFVTFIRKAFGHFGLFAISGFFTSLAVFLSINPFKWSKYYMPIILSLEFGLLMGLVTELIQLNVSGRSGELMDVLIDFGGYLLGFLLIFVILFLIIKHLNKNKMNNKECIY
jgi:VanZ family protein